MAFLIIVLTPEPETLITATPDVPCAEDWAAIVPESLWILVFTICFYFAPGFAVSILLLIPVSYTHLTLPTIYSV